MHIDKAWANRGYSKEGCVFLLPNRLKKSHEDIYRFFSVDIFFSASEKSLVINNIESYADSFSYTEKEELLNIITPLLKNYFFNSTQDEWNYEKNFGILNQSFWSIKNPIINLSETVKNTDVKKMLINNVYLLANSQYDYLLNDDFFIIGNYEENVFRNFIKSSNIRMERSCFGS